VPLSGEDGSSRVRVVRMFFGSDIPDDAVLFQGTGLVPEPAAGHWWELPPDRR
jgi:hypothetical protein